MKPLSRQIRGIKRMRNLILLSVLTVFISLIFYSCKKELHIKDNIDDRIKTDEFVDKKIMSWYNGKYGNSDTVTTNQFHVYVPGESTIASGKKYKKYKIKWDDGKTYYKGDSTVVEVPLNPKDKEYIVAGSSKDSKQLKKAMI